MPRSKVPQEDVFVGDHGSGFFVQGPHVDVGYVVLAPGDEVPNHHHAHIDEGFYTIAGSVALWIDGTDRIDLRPGDFFLCDAGVMHYLVNEDHVPWRALFIKAPHVPGDRVTSAWRPGDAAPAKAERTGG